MTTTDRMHRGAVAHRAGQAAEMAVADDYRRRGYGVACMRWRGRAGEVDLIARDGDGLIFVEVKRGRSFSRAAERLGRRQMERLCTTAQEFCATEPHGSLTEIRFDVALVDQYGAVRVIENAFGTA